MQLKLYTARDILAAGLLKNYLGEPYKHRASIVRVIKKLPHQMIPFKGGMTIAITLDEITRFNKHWSQ